MLMPASARVGKLGERKASNALEFTFVERLPLSSWELKKMLTSGTMALPRMSLAAAISTADTRFSLPSVRGEPMGSWLPVKITGLCRWSSMKLSTDALYAMVSVPWSTMKPSYSEYFALMSSASSTHMAGSTSDESIRGSKV